MAKPTREDALIMIQLAQWGATLGLTEASSWMWSDEFIPDGEGFAAKYPAGSEGFSKDRGHPLEERLVQRNAALRLAIPGDDVG